MAVKVLFVIPTATSYRSFLTELTDLLCDKGVSIYCATKPVGLDQRTASAARGCIKEYPLSMPRGINLRKHFHAARSINRLVEIWKPDIIHAHFSAAVFTTALAHRSEWPITVGTYQGVTSFQTTGLKGWLLKVAEKWAVSRLDEVWVLTQDDLDMLRVIAPEAVVNKQQAYGFGCDLSTFHPHFVSQEQRAALLLELGLTREEFVFVYVGRFVDFKGFDTVVRAFLHYSQQNPRARLLLVGKRDELHPTGLTSKEETELDHSDSIIRVGWQPDVVRYLSISDVMVFPSNREGIPVCLMEALAMGVPVITKDSRGCRDVVRDQVDGFVMKKSDPKELVEKMATLAEKPELRRTFSQNALVGRNRFDRNHYVKEQYNIYRKWIFLPSL